MKYRVQLRVLLGLLVLSLVATTSFAWQANLRGNLSRADPERRMAIDQDGNILAVGCIYYLVNGQYRGMFSVVKLSSKTGAEIWHTMITDSTSTFGCSSSVTIAPNGDIVAAGYINQKGTGSDFAIVRLDAVTGAERWRRVFDGGLKVDDTAWTVSVDSAGDVVAGGRLCSNQQSSFFVIKVSGSDGRDVWRHTVEVEGGVLAGDVFAVRIDSAGDVLAAGATARNYRDYDFRVVKLSGSTGNLVWSYDVNGSAGESDFALDLALDSAENAVAVGSIDNSVSGGDFFVAKLSRDNGAEMWRKVLNSTANGSDWANAVTIDKNANVIAAGGLDLGPGEDFFVVKLAGESGEELWSRTIKGTAGRQDEAEGLATDGDGDIIAVGQTTNTLTDHDFTMVKLAHGSGEVLWTALLSGTRPGGFPHGSNDVAYSAAVDSCGNAVALGSTENVDEADVTVMKLVGETGQDFKPDAPTLLDLLMCRVARLDLPPGISESLKAKLDASRRSSQDSSGGSGTGPLKAFVREVEALQGKKIPASDADGLIKDAGEILKILNGLSAEILPQNPTGRDWPGRPIKKQ